MLRMTEDFPNPYAADATLLPPIIQGGMGVGVSGWRLANAVSKLGQLGVIFGICLCNSLCASTGIGQIRDSYTAADVVERLLA
jgi:NAD(P)H-dependent flavin oxidoreductase YrpB (nitropropane dioxygenase family)